MRANIKPFQRFYEVLNTAKTRENFILWINKFFDYTKTDSDGIVKLKPDEIEDSVFNYIVHLKLRTEKDSLSPNSIRPMIAPIKLFCEVNGILLNWKYLMKLFPKSKPARNQGAWTNEEIQKMLGATTNLRNKAMIHFLASTGCRVGAIFDLKISDLIKINDGAVIWLYNEDLERYRTCLTPEAYKALMDYFGFRAEKGYPVTKDEDSLFTMRDYKTPMNYETARAILSKIQMTAGIRGQKAGKKISSKAPNHAFRKRFETVLVNSGLHVKYVNYMMGHKVGQDRSYFKPTNDELWNHFKKAIPELIINQEEKLRFKNYNLQLQNEEYENELKQRLAEIEEKYQDVIEEQKTRLWVEQMKNYFHKQLDGKGHPHTDPKYREFMRKFIEAEPTSEVMRLLKADNELIYHFEEIEKN